MIRTTLLLVLTAMLLSTTVASAQAPPACHQAAQVALRR
jgi:hypothetical protein